MPLRGKQARTVFHSYCSKRCVMIVSAKVCVCVPGCMYSTDVLHIQ